MVKAIKAAQLADQIRDSLAEWTSRDLPGYFFSITQVTLTPDLTRATVWVDSLVAKEQSNIINKLNKNVYSYQKELGKKLRRKYVPKISFVPDEREALMKHIDNLLK